MNLDFDVPSEHVSCLYVACCFTKPSPGLCLADWVQKQLESGKGVTSSVKIGNTVMNQAQLTQNFQSSSEASGTICTVTYRGLVGGPWDLVVCWPSPPGSRWPDLDLWSKEKVVFGRTGAFAVLA